MTEGERLAAAGRAEVVFQPRARLGEGPLWDDAAQLLYWVDIYNHRVHRFDPATGTDQVHEVGEVVGSVALTATSALLLALRHHLALLDPATGELERVATVLPAGSPDRLNDGKCDPAGRFWIGSMSREQGRAALYRCDPDGAVQQMETGLTISNGLGWSPDARTFYLTDSGAKRIYAYDFDVEAGAIGQRRVLVDRSGEPSTPDGLAVDAEGCLWSAQWDGGCVIRFAPDGRELQRVTLPVQRPTSCAFGGSDRSDLYITSASVGLSEQEIERGFHSGDLFRARGPVAGLAAERFGSGRAG